MGKHVVEFPSKNPERSIECVEDYLSKQGFWLVGRPGREVWRRGSKARVLSPEYISLAPGDGVVHVEAWVKAVTPFVGVWVGNANPYKGAPVSLATKERLRKRLERIEQLVG